MNRIFSILLLLSAVLLSSCIEIIDDITVHSDGSGHFAYNVNLSGSRVKINSILALDSLNGKKVPSLDEIKEQIISFETALEAEDGISNVTISRDFDNFIFKLNCDFESIQQLQVAVKDVVKKELENNHYPELNHNWMSFEDERLTRSIPPLTVKKVQELEQKDQDLLKEGVYTSITRFDTLIVKCDNKNAKISKNQKAVMLRTDPYSLINTPSLLDNVIFLAPKEEE